MDKKLKLTGTTKKFNLFIFMNIKIYNVFNIRTKKMSVT